MLRIFLISVIIVIFCNKIFAQSVDIPVECGNIVESEFTDNFQEHFYRLELNIGDQISAQVVSLEPNPDLQGFVLAIINADGRTAASTSQIVEHDVTTSTDLLQYRGINTIKVQNWSRVNNQNVPRGIGRYNLYIGCTLRAGTKIEPGTVLPTEEPQEFETSPSPSFSGFGFPGLAAVDFSKAVHLPVPTGVAMGGAITPNGGEIIGYQFEGNMADSVDLSFTRFSGNLNVGLAVIDNGNNVVYQASLVNTITMSAQFTLPATGEYTVGIFPIYLLPPDNPEATTFQMTISVTSR